MSWDDPSTDMAHCRWCGWDLYKKDAVDYMHAKCVAKNNRRRTLREALIPVLIESGAKQPDRGNLLTELCLRIEAALDEEQKA